MASNLIQLVNLLHTSGNPKAPEVEKFIQQHKPDPVFAKRYPVVMKAFLANQQRPLATTR